jgi:hypothetical protein
MTSRDKGPPSRPERLRELIVSFDGEGLSNLGGEKKRFAICHFPFSICFNLENKIMLRMPN